MKQISNIIQPIIQPIIRPIIDLTPEPIFDADLRYSLYDDVTHEIGEHVRSSIATYQGDDGYLKTASANIPRFEGSELLTEPLHENDCLWNRDFSNVAWSKVVAPAISKNAIGIDGIANTAHTIADNSTIASEFVFQVVSGQATDSTNTAVIFIGKDSDETRFPAIQVGFTGGSAISSIWHLNTKTGVLLPEGGSQAGSASSTSYNDDFWKITVTLTNNGTGNTDYSIVIYPAIGNVQGTPNPTTTGSAVFDMPNIFVGCGCDFNPVETAGAPVPVATESGYPRWDLPVINPLGTAIVRWTPLYNATDMPVSTIDKGILSVADSGDSLISCIREAGGTNKLIATDGTNDSDITLAWVAGTTYKIVVKWGYSDKMRIGVDSGSGIAWGTEVAYDGSLTVGDYLRIGYDLFGPMHINGLQIYNKVLTDSQIDSIRRY